MLGIISAKNVSLSDPGALFLDKWGDGIFQSPNKKINISWKMLKIYEDSKINLNSVIKKKKSQNLGMICKN